MVSGPKRSSRLAVKERDVINYLRQRIILGELALGARIPPRRELERQLKVSSVTVQRALNQLIRDGFVQARGPKGTFVSENPPHLSRYGIVFPYRPTDEHPWRRFWTALWKESMRLEQSLPVRVPVFYEAQRLHSHDADHEELANDVDAQRLAGVFFINAPKRLMGDPVLTRPDLPRVVMAREPFPGCASLFVDMECFCQRAIEALASSGRRRIAILTVPHMTRWEQQLASIMVSKGMETRSYWTQLVPQDNAEYAQNVMHMMFHPGQSDRPDGLIILDDNLVEYAAAGILTANVKVPQDLDIVAHCNHPWPTPSVIPMRRLGFDARDVMRLVMQSIDEQRRGGPRRTDIRVKAVFSDEVAPV